MRIRTTLLAVFVISGCAANDPQQQSTFPQQPQQLEQSGPPGGGMDPQYAYQGPPQQQYAGPQYGAPQQPPPQYSVNAEAQPPQDDGQQYDGDQQQPQGEPSADPSDPNYVMGDVNDSEIDQTLAPYGQWEDDDGTQVWVPNTTTVGMDFMPYSTCGSWMWSDAGWNFSCDYAWGWLPFHYGRWGWFNNHWGWTRGYKWGPGWVDWRSGGGVVGWRPMAPGVGHYAMHDSHWSFVHENQLGSGHIAGHLTVGGAEGLHATHAVGSLSVRGNYTPVSSASLMRGRMQTQHDIRVNSAVHASTSATMRNQQRSEQPTWQHNTSTNSSVRSYNNNNGSRGYSTYRSTGPARAYGGNMRGGSHASSSSSFHSSSSSSHASSSHSSGGGHSGGGGHHR